jgi:hypothetical protein
VLKTTGKKILYNTSRRSSVAFLAGKKKFNQENFYLKETVEQVPEKPLQTHHNKPSSIISGSSVATMGIFPLRGNTLMLCEPKPPRAS